MEYLAPILGIAGAALGLSALLAKIIAALIGRVGRIGDALTKAITGLNATLVAHSASEHERAQRISLEIGAARDHVVRAVDLNIRDALHTAGLLRDLP